VSAAWFRDATFNPLSFVMTKLLLKFFTIGVLFLGALPATQAAPNLLIILTDDQGYGDLSLHGNPYIETPNLDRLGKEGVQFDRFYVNSVCAPTRAALLTGRYPVRAGTHSVTRNREAFRPGEVTFGNAFQQAGYRTGYFGKWHNGAQYPNIPTGKGFDEFFGFTAGHINNYFDAVLLRGTSEEKSQGYVTDVLTDEAMAFMKPDAEAPFLCYLNYNAPHNPYQLPDSFYDPLVAEGLSPSAAGHFGMVKNIDENLGRLFDHLEKIGAWENTIIVFLTDNGAAGSAGRYYNAGMRGYKTSTHEGGSRVPFFISWPSAKWEPHVVAELAQHVDLYPTLVDLAGIEMPEGPPLDGVSLKPLIEKSAADWTERMLFTHNGIDETNRYPGAVRTPRYRLVTRIKGPQAGSQSVNRDETRTPWELYDMKEDPGEANDVAADHPELVVELSALYEDWVDDIFSEGLRRWPIPVGYDEQNPVQLHASQAYIEAPVAYAVGGFAHDWLTNWTDKSGEIAFEIDVVAAGAYEVEIAYTSSPENAGSVITVEAAGTSASATVAAFAPVDITLPHRDEASNERYRNREWGILKVGKLDLPEGVTKITIRADSISNGAVIDFKHLALQKSGS